MNDKLNSTKGIISLYSNGKNLHDFVTIRLPEIREKYLSGKARIDKHTDGFSREENIQSMNIRVLSYSSFTGSYGDSSTYSDISNINSTIMADYFLQYLNRHKDEILMEMATYMIKDAESRKQEALQEIEALKTKIENLQDESMD